MNKTKGKIIGGWLLFVILMPLTVSTGQDTALFPPPSGWVQFGHQNNWRTSLILDSEMTLSEAWNVEIGQGRSQVVGIGENVYATTGSSEKKDGKNQITMRTVAIDLASGRETWSREQSWEMYDEQEAFGASKASPQATPVITGNRLITIGFTGQLTCLNRSDGKRIWEIDLVRDLGAEPVQFGFAASPVVDSKQPDRVYVLAAGKSAGFYCLDINDGSVIWKFACKTCSYATPLMASFGGVDQWVIVTADEVLGISKENGKQLWRHEFSETGLTNVPTPLLADDARLLISGQGSKGVRCLGIGRQGATWTVAEQWFIPRIQYFYTNWAKFNDRVVVGCTDKYLAAFDLSDGSILGRYRGFSDGNVTIAGQDVVVVDGKGVLSLLQPEIYSDAKMTGFSVNKQFKILDARCWTPLSVIGDRILVRGDDRLVCLTISSSKDAQPLENLAASTKTLLFERELSELVAVDPVELIFATFEAKGQEAALAVYAKLRADKQLDEQSRVALVLSAKEQGLNDVAKLIVTQALEDFPQSEEIKSTAKSILDN